MAPLAVGRKTYGSFRTLMKTHRQALVFTNIIVLVVLSLSLLPAEHLDAQERVRAGYSGISGYQAPLWLGIDLGLFKKYGLTLEPILFRGGAESTHALSGNEIQFDVVSPQPHIAANLSGADIVIIGTYFNKHTYSFVARPGIRSPQDLRGKKVGVLSVVGLNQIVVAAALRHWAMDDRSVTLVRTGGSRDRFAALQNGLIDATVLTGAFVERAKAAGLPVLLDLGDLEDAFPTVSMMTTRSFQSSKRFVVRSFLQGLGEAIYVFKDDPVLGKKTFRNGCALKTQFCSTALTKAMRRKFLFRPTAKSRAFSSWWTIWRTPAPTLKAKKRRSSSMKKFCAS